MPTTEGFLSAKTKDIEFCLKRETTMKSLRAIVIHWACYLFAWRLRGMITRDFLSQPIIVYAWVNFLLAPKYYHSRVTAAHFRLTQTCDWFLTLLYAPTFIYSNMIIIACSELSLLLPGNRNSSSCSNLTEAQSVTLSYIHCEIYCFDKKWFYLPCPIVCIRATYQVFKQAVPSNIRMWTSVLHLVDIKLL